MGSELLRLFLPGQKGLLGFRQVVSRDFKLVPIGVGKVNRVSDPVIMELERNASLLQVLLGLQQVGVCRAKCHMAHRRLGGAAGSGRRLGRTRRKQGNTSRASAKHGRTISPRFPVTTFQAKHVLIPGDRLLQIFHRQGNVIDLLEREHDGLTHDN